MSTKLSKTTKDVKRLLLYFGFFVFFVLFTTWIGGLTNPDKPSPPEAGQLERKDFPPADTLFGQIQIPVIQSLTIDPTSKAIISKSITPFAQLPPVAKVYPLKPEREYSGDADTARLAAKLLNFTSEETKVINNIMYWETPEKNRVFSYDKAQSLWDFHYNIYPQTTTAGFIPNISEYPGMVTAIAPKLGINTNLFLSESNRVDLVNVGQDGQMTTVTSNPNFARVTLFKRVSLSKPLASKNPELYTDVRRYHASSGIIEALVQGDGKDVNLGLWQFRYKQYTYDNPSYYYLITPLEAYSRIQTQKTAFLYQMTLDNSNYFSDAVGLNVDEFTLNVDKTTIVYLEPDSRTNEQPWTNYLQPFYYFTGTFVTKDQQKGTCTFIVPALVDESYRSKTTP